LSGRDAGKEGLAVPFCPDNPACPGRPAPQPASTRPHPARVRPAAPTSPASDRI